MNSTERFKVVMNILDKADLCNNTVNHVMFEKLKDDELTDDNKVNTILEQAKAYEDRIENNTNRYPEEIMQALRQRNGLDKYDTHLDSELNKIEPDEAFSEVVNWNGLLGGWDYTIKHWIKSIYGIEIGEQ